MANLQIKGIKDELYEEIKKLAASENRSVSQQVLFLIRQYLSTHQSPGHGKTGAEVLLELSGSWEDVKSADEIIREIKGSRKSSEKLAKGL